MKSDWIEKMNEMFLANVYTSGKRVTIDYCENADKILITVCGDTAIISNLERYTEYGLMIECIKIVDALYNNTAETLFKD